MHYVRDINCVNDIFSRIFHNINIVTLKVTLLSRHWKVHCGISLYIVMQDNDCNVNSAWSFQTLTAFFSNRLRGTCLAHFSCRQPYLQVGGVEVAPLNTLTCLPRRPITVSSIRLTQPFGPRRLHFFRYFFLALHARVAEVYLGSCFFPFCTWRESEMRSGFGVKLQPWKRL